MLKKEAGKFGQDQRKETRKTNEKEDNSDRNRIR